MNMMNQEQWNALKVLMEMPIMLAACYDALEKGIPLRQPEKVDALIDAAESAVPMVSEWMKSELVQEVGKAVAWKMASGGEFPPEMQWAADELKKMQEVEP